MAKPLKDAKLAKGRLFDFTKRKFQTLPLTKQHKQCAELLWQIYHLRWLQEEQQCEGNASITSPERELLQGKWQTDWLNYSQLLQWMSQPDVKDPTIKMIADLYHQHARSAGIHKKEHNLLPKISVGDRLESETPWPLAIYLDHIRSAHNVGSIIRTIEAFALGSLYFSDDTPFIDCKQVKDAAMGAHQWVKGYQHVALAALPKPIIALETCPEAVSLYDYTFPPSFTLVVGNEEYGCSENV